MRVEKREAKNGFKCACCGEYIKTCEKYFQVVSGGKPVRGERYCIECESYAYENNEIEMEVEDDGERFLRQMEDYAAYHAAGCTSAYWEDRDAGYAE